MTTTTPKFLELGTCAWIRSPLPGQKVRIRNTRGQDPYLSLMPEDFFKAVKALVGNIRTHLNSRSVESPWDSGTRYVPYKALPQLQLALKFQLEEFEEKKSIVVRKWPSILDQAQQTIKAIAEKEYKLQDPRGLTDKKIWVTEFYEGSVQGLTTQQEFKDGAAIQIVLGSFVPASHCPSGFHTLGHEALYTWAEDIVWYRLEPLKKTLMALRQSCQEDMDPTVILNARRDARWLMGHYQDFVQWDLTPDQFTQDMKTLIEYFSGVEKQILAPKNHDVRRKLADLTLPPLLYLSQTQSSGIQDRINKLL